MGWDPRDATSTALATGSLRAFLELHIEQGPELDTSGTDIGLVTDIVGLGGGLVEFHGRSDHAGTTSMTRRLDPMPAAGSFLAQIPKIAGQASDAAVLTCGLIDVEPGGTNVVPELVRLHLDFRAPDRQVLVEVERWIAAAAADCAEQHGVESTYRRESITPPTPLDGTLRACLQRRTRARGLSTTTIPSGAGHDSQNMSRLTPTSMVFVPSTGGSHNPKEHCAWKAIENGANVLLDTVIEVACQV